MSMFEYFNLDMLINKLNIHYATTPTRVQINGIPFNPKPHQKQEIHCCQNQVNTDNYNEITQLDMTSKLNYISRNV